MTPSLNSTQAWKEHERNSCVPAFKDPRADWREYLDEESRNAVRKFNNEIHHRKVTQKAYNTNVFRTRAVTNGAQGEMNTSREYNVNSGASNSYDGSELTNTIDAKIP